MNYKCQCLLGGQLTTICKCISETKYLPKNCVLGQEKEADWIIDEEE